MANIEIYTGNTNPASVAGNTPFGLYDTEQAYRDASANTTLWCARRLGYPIVDIELHESQFFACFEEAVSEYGAQVNRFNIRENLLSAKGNSTSSNYTQKLVDRNLGRLIALSKQYGTEVGSGGTVDWRLGHITTLPNIQEYDLNLVLSSSSGVLESNEIEIQCQFC